MGGPATTRRVTRSNESDRYNAKSELRRMFERLYPARLGGYAHYPPLRPRDEDVTEE